MIDAFDVTNFKRTQSELEEYWLFCVAVAGKTATIIAKKINQFLSDKYLCETPFDYVRRLNKEGRLEARMREVKLGKYTNLVPSYTAISAADAPDLRTAAPAEFETIRGVGEKTSRYFILHSRENANVAAIDTHVLKYLKARGYTVTKGIPKGKAYARLEGYMLAEMAASGMTPADFDLALWSHYASKGKYPLPQVDLNLLAA